MFSQKSKNAVRKLTEQCNDLACAVRENPQVLAQIKMPDIQPLVLKNNDLKHVGVFAIVVGAVKILMMGMVR